MQAPSHTGPPLPRAATAVLPLLRAHAETSPHRVAIEAPGRRAASYEQLLCQVVAVTERLRAAAIGTTDRVALVLPNGPDLAVAFLGTVAAAVCTPLAPDAPQAHFERELTDLGARALVVARGHETAARDAAAALGVPVIELEPGDVAGAFTYTHDGVDAPPPSTHRVAGDAALLLFTSGTTSKPKLVPLSEQNLLHSAANVAATLGLGPEDRSLNVMPLFHIHGLVASLLASLVAGGSVVCTPGFRAPAVPGWLDEFRPTWYTAVPTIHQAMLEVAAPRGSTNRSVRSDFRFIRSSSAALPRRVMEQLEQVFEAPVIEAYGMTEAAHQIASNPWHPGRRKPGTVGKPAGPEVAVLGEDGRVFPPGAVGEIAIKGATVTTGYLDNPAANDAAFVDGWFRTGDLGSFDDDGYLTITGRLKEIINRGGEKVSPREVDDTLLSHPEVVQAVTFAVPHPQLGEEVAAAVVLQPGAVVTSGALREHTAARLSPAQVPRKIVVLDEIPMGPTGKLQRVGLGAQLGLDGAQWNRANRSVVGPRDDVEERLVTIVRDVLQLDELVSVTDDFFDLGGDSLHTVELFEQIEMAFGQPISAASLLDGATVEHMAAALRRDDDRIESIVPVQPEGPRPPLFCLLRDETVLATRNFVPALGPEQPIFGIWMPALHGSATAGGTVEDVAARGVDLLRAARPEGPYYLFGHSLGGIVIYEMAHRLVAAGQHVGLVVLADAPHPRMFRGPVSRFMHEGPRRARTLVTRRGPAAIARRVQRLARRAVPAERLRPVYPPGTAEPFDRTAAMRRERRYRPGPSAWPTVLFATRQFSSSFHSPSLGWESLLTSDWEVHEVPGSHDSMLGEPHVFVLAETLARCLRQAQQRL